MGWFGKKTASAGRTVTKMKNRDTVEGVVWGAVWVAFADGNFSKDEKSSLIASLKAIPALAVFAGEVTGMVDRAVALFDTGVRMGKQEAKRQLADLANDPENAATVMNVVLTVADEGEIDDKERKILEDIAAAMNLSLSDFE